MRLHISCSSTAVRHLCGYIEESYKQFWQTLWISKGIAKSKGESSAYIKSNTKTVVARRESMSYDVDNDFVGESFYVEKMFLIEPKIREKYDKNTCPLSQEAHHLESKDDARLPILPESSPLISLRTLQQRLESVFCESASILRARLDWQDGSMIRPLLLHRSLLSSGAYIRGSTTTCTRPITVI
ncbi:hypothetical protein L202_02055 [Cryptococcus amylolentus CBS 6039]|uniref:Uncharacterized protein n=1 Tax=Cryptococcus amylolentus CBS 6039 TaxID=1295533 RepID=A0A1E3I0Z3_9TREE|nr:hypothetical protein L202_02055 [Cryptococcus amylolentus CBS 6039]ODN81656.1 hypothetical protein L202_02055 [Cryptococcus amylolentus CBS 6039]